MKLADQKKDIPNINMSLLQRGGGGKAGSDVLREQNLEVCSVILPLPSWYL